MAVLALEEFRMKVILKSLMTVSTDIKLF